MTTSKITTLQAAIQNANTADQSGRQIVANACRELYNLIETSLYDKYGEHAIVDAYNDLCNGNFAAPFMAEQKKQKFTLYMTIFNRLA